jgi:PAS domain S-box-containing protein
MKLLFLHSGNSSALKIKSELTARGIQVTDVSRESKGLSELSSFEKFELVLFDVFKGSDDLIQEIKKYPNSESSLIFLVAPAEENYLLERGLILKDNYVYNDLPVGHLIQFIQVILNQRQIPSLQQEEYQLVVENANDGIIIARDEKIVFYNSQCLFMTGYKAKEVNGKDIFDFISESSRHSTKKAFRRWIDSKKPISIFETQLLKKEGGVIQVEMNSRIIYYKNLPSVIILIRDISERINIHEALKESELSYRSIFDHAGDAIYIQDQHGIFLDVNPAAMRMYGYSRVEMVGNTPEMLTAIGLNDMNATKFMLERAFNGETQRFEWWGRRKNGEIFPKDVVLNKGKYFGKDVVFAMARDITERFEVLKALKKSEDKYRSLTNQLPVGVYRTKPDGSLIFSNPALAKILGYASAEELYQQNVEELYVRPEERMSQLKLSKSAEDVIQNEFQLRRKDGVMIWVRDNSRVFFDSSGKPEYFDGVLEDITNQKEAERALRESEGKLRATLKSNPDLMFRYDMLGNFLDYHANTDDELYLKPDHIIGSNIRDHFSQEIAAKILKSIEKCLETGEIQTMEYTLEIKGEKRIFEARYSPIDKDEVLSFSRDITIARRKQEEFLMLARALMSVNDCVTITDKNNNFLFVNDKFCDVYGYQPEELKGKSCMVLRADELGIMEDEILQATIKGGWKGELMNRKKDGTFFPIHLSTSAVKDENDEVFVLIGVSNDISEQKRTEKELMEAKERAEESDRLKSAFLANMSHEIRSPMNAILGFSHLLKDENLSITARQYVDMISNSGNHLLAVINDVVDISKIQANQLQILNTEFCLMEFMDELYNNFSLQIKTNENYYVALRKAIPAEYENYLIIADKLRLRQVFLNLLSNALKFTTKGYIEFGFEIVRVHEIRFFVADTGVGISQENQEVIFERFRQADDSLSRNYGGAGLGLAISRGLVELMGGKIWVESEPNKGSVFYFSLPVESLDRS